MRSSAKALLPPGQRVEGTTVQVEHSLERLVRQGLSEYQPWPYLRHAVSKMDANNARLEALDRQALGANNPGKLCQDPVRDD
jgi:hypothetical protein